MLERGLAHERNMQKGLEGSSRLCRGCMYVPDFMAGNYSVHAGGVGVKAVAIRVAGLYQGQGSAPGRMRSFSAWCADERGSRRGSARQRVGIVL